MDKIIKLAKFLQEKRFFNQAKRKGLNPNNVHAISLAEDESGNNPSDSGIYYYYSGPLDDKTRPFCRLMLKLDKVFSEEVLNEMSRLLGYDVLVECGKWNCRHNFVKFRGKFVDTPGPTTREINKLLKEQADLLGL